MNDVWQSYSEEGTNQPQLHKTVEEFQTFKISTPGVAASIVIYFLTIGLIMLPQILGWYKGLKPGSVMLSIMLQGFVGGYLSVLLNNLFQTKKTINLYENKIVLINKTASTILFSEIKTIPQIPFFNNDFGTDSIWSFYYPYGLSIKLRNGQTKRIIGNNKDMFRFLNSFEAKIQSLPNNSQTSIERSDENVPNYVPIILLILGITAIVISLTYLFWHNGLRPDYS